LVVQFIPATRIANVAAEGSNPPAWHNRHERLEQQDILGKDSRRIS
jgi:hypothetical protein